MDTAQVDARLTDLELRYMQLERFVEELSEVVAAQRDELDLLRAEAKRLRERLTAELDAEPLPHEKPPHY